jgi:hypothetical protein
MRIQKIVGSAASVAAVGTGLALVAAPTPAQACAVGFQHSNGGGGRIGGCSGDSDLSNNYFDNGYWANDAISSVNTDSYIKLYEHANYAGASTSLSPGSWNLGALNDRTSSVKPSISNGC